MALPRIIKRASFDLQSCVKPNSSEDSSANWLLCRAYLRKVGYRFWYIDGLEYQSDRRRTWTSEGLRSSLPNKQPSRKFV